MKQAELAEIIGVEPRSISRIESGCHFPKDEHLEKFAKAFNVEIKDLFNFSTVENPKYIPQINKMLLNADANQLRIIYKIVETIIN